MPIAKVIPSTGDRTTVSVKLSVYLQVDETQILYTLDGSDPASQSGHGESHKSIYLVGFLDANPHE